MHKQRDAGRVPPDGMQCFAAPARTFGNWQQYEHQEEAAEIEVEAGLFADESSDSSVSLRSLRSADDEATAAKLSTTKKPKAKSKTKNEGPGECANCCTEYRG